MVALASPTVVVNGDVVAIKPNSLKFKEGQGDRNVRTQSTGGGAVTQVITEDVETQRGMVSFTVLTTSDAVEKSRTWQRNKEANTIEISDRGGFARSFQSAIIVSDLEKALGADQDFEVEFESKPAV
ncbi:MAG: hypothetical protein OEM38_00490 [Gammaproteobacteria bacterium]|nr:hypothetical protein [Gammaproteobacteria bacterium]